MTDVHVYEKKIFSIWRAFRKILTYSVIPLLSPEVITSLPRNHSPILRSCSKISLFPLSQSHILITAHQCHLMPPTSLPQFLLSSSPACASFFLFVFAILLLKISLTSLQPYKWNVSMFNFFSSHPNISFAWVSSAIFQPRNNFLFTKMCMNSLSIYCKALGEIIVDKLATHALKLLS